MRTLFSHFGYVKGFFPDYFTDSIIENEEEEQFVVSQPENDAVNNDDANLFLGILTLPVVCGNTLPFPVTNQRK